MSADLTPLEQAAARVGLPGLKARIVPHDQRLGWWFRWGDGKLLVSDRVIDRCPPDDACALLLNDILLRKRLRSRRRPLWFIGLPAAVALVTLTPVQCAASMASAEGAAAPHPWILTAVIISLCAIFLFSLAWSAGTSLAWEWADDETVRLLGDATPLVRGLNEMNFEEIHLAGKVLPARPDLHRRAERLVRKYRLCESQPPA